MRHLKLLVFPSLVALFALIALQFPARSGSGVAEAYPNVDNLGVTGQTCLSDGSVGLSLSWTTYNLGGQWVDLTLFNNGFAPGSFISLGPLSASQNSFTWNGLRPGLLHYLRLNTLTANGWFPTSISFTTRGDCAPYPSGEATNVAVVTQACDAGGVTATVTWIASGQGTQWLDLSLYDNGFAPGTFVGFGPMTPTQNSATWPGLLPGYFHFLRVNTGAPAGWAPSPRIAFQTRSDCPAGLPATPVPTATPVPPTPTPVPATATPKVGG
jgi:hypothetical protein